jgi:hypothetical protein
MGSCYPSTHQEMNSYQHRNFLNRLCYAFRFSQPLDVLLRPNPFPPCFMRVAPMGLRPSEVFPLQKPETSHNASSLHAVSRRISFIGEPMRSLRRRGSKGLSNWKVRSVEHGVTRRTPADPLLASHLSEVFTPLASTSCFHEVSFLGLSRLAERRTAHLDAGSAKFQRTGGLACLFRELPTSLRSSSFTVTSRKKSRCRTS